MEVFQKTEPNVKGSVSVISGLNPQQTTWLKEAVKGKALHLQESISKGDDVETDHLDFLLLLGIGLKTTDEVINERSSEPDPEESDYVGAPV